MPRQRKRGIKGAGSVYQRKSDKRYVGSFMVEETGKRKYIYADTEKEAWEKLQQAQQEQKQGMFATGLQRKLGPYLQDWLETTHKPPIVKPRTYIAYRTIINRHLTPTLGHITLQKLTSQMVQSMFAKKLAERLAPRTISLIHAVLHEALEDAIRWNLITKNVASSKFVHLPQLEKHEAQVIDVEQAKALLEMAKGSDLETLILLAVTTGMRRGEILALRWSDIDFERKILHIHRSVGRVAGYSYLEGDPKTKSSRRKIMVPDVVLTSLQSHRELQIQVQLKAGDKWKGTNLVFCNRYGGYKHFDVLLAHFHKLTDAVGLPHMRFHDLRHSAATILLLKGVHPKIVQELLGHSSIQMTMDTYSHILPSLQKEATQAMNDLFQ